MAQKRDSKQVIRIRGANEHNLKNIVLDSTLPQMWEGD